MKRETVLSLASELESMRRVALRRPHDQETVWIKPPIALGQATLRITPESLHESFPCADIRPGLVLVADARIDNREELLETFGLKSGGSVGDDTLILRAYEKWGEACAEHLLGDFVFVIWDASKQRLFGARDPFGVKTLFFYESGDFFAFSTDAKAMLATSFVPPALSEEMIARHLLYLEGDDSLTFYKNIQHIRPAHAFVVDRNRFVTRRYWALDARRVARHSTDADYAAEFRQIFFESVRCRMRSAHPVGAFLSGGLDSSSIACAARLLIEEKGGGDLHTFSGVFEDTPTCDERPFIQTVTSQPSIRPHFIHADRIGPFEKIEATLAHADEVHQCHLSMLWNGIYPEAQRQGVRVLLDGEGGDEVVFRGYPYLAELLKRGRMRACWSTGRALATNLGEPCDRVLFQKAIRPLLPSPLLYLWRLLKHGRKALWFDRYLLNPAFAKRIHMEEKERRQIELEMRSPSDVRKEHARLLASPAIPYSFQVMDKAAAAFSIEHRYPFHDRRLAEYCLALPSNQKLRRGWTKFILRSATDGILPEKIRWRGGKTYLSDDFTQSLLREGREMMSDAIVRDPSRIEPYINIEILRKTYNQFLSTPTYQSGVTVWQATLFSIWLKSLNHPSTPWDPSAAEAASG